VPARGVVLLQQVASEIAPKVPPHRVDVVCPVLVSRAAHSGCTDISWCTKSADDNSFQK